MAFAQGSSVPVGKSKSEIEQVLHRYGASEFMYGTRVNEVVVGFKVKNRMVKMTVPMPSIEKFRKTPHGSNRGLSAAQSELDAEHRRLWRALLLMIKAKLEGVQSGIATFEDEFLPYTVMANGQTVADWARPQLNSLAESSQMPKLLPQ